MQQDRMKFAAPFAALCAGQSGRTLLTAVGGVRLRVISRDHDHLLEEHPEIPHSPGSHESIPTNPYSVVVAALQPPKVTLSPKP